jgi:arylsulfatase A-like enzyme
MMKLFLFPFLYLLIQVSGQLFGSTKPNIIFIMVDDMGYHDLGCYGSKTISTPNIDRMAKEGIRFTDCYSGDTVCASARSTLMTGYHKGHTPVRGNSGGIPLFPEDITVAEVLKKAGYVTGGFGKWGLGNQGKDGAAERQGFDLFYGYYNQWHAHTYYTHLFRNSKKVDKEE